MTLTEALQTIERASANASAYQAIIACGFTPLHLSTFFAAHLQRRMPDRKVAVSTGLYGDLLGTIRKSRGQELNAVAIAVEWSDLDPRLGYRSLGGWGPAEQIDVVRQVDASLAAVRRAIEELADATPVVVSFPTLPLPPAFITGSWQAGDGEASLHASVFQTAAALSAHPAISVVSPQRLDSVSPAGARYDFKSDLLTGLPYTRVHASQLAEAMAHLIAPPSPKKGLITDLDDTFWSGIAGEVGPDGVTWDLHNHSQIHGLYQQMLRALADQGVLVAIASKNDPAVVERALARADVIMPAEKIFPIEVHWHAKSGSVSRVLKAWNIGPDDVVFIDDSPMELAEVKQAFPGIECLQFPKTDYPEAEVFLRRVRDLFSRKRVLAEDALRRESLRTAVVFAEQADGDASDDFLRSLNASLSVDTSAAADPRSLELVNKTNQFNLNGRRYDPSEWQAGSGRPGALVWSIAYTDRFGPLGKIAILGGVVQDRAVVVDTWVMSCRAFARRIEHQCLSLLFERTGADEIVFCFRATERNGPLQEFLSGILGQPAESGARLTRENFILRTSPLFHTIQGSQA